MVWVKRGILAILALLAIGLIGVFATGKGPLLRVVWDISTGAPELPFDAATQPGTAPDYSEPRNWAALPTRDDLADLVPAGVDSLHAPGASPVDVFFVHPTGFLKGSSWTFSMDPDTSTEENTQWMMANQASPYNGCCNVYAPRYRQASIFAYLRADEMTRDAALGFAYKDVERAFEYYLEHYNNGRPFILASHSQGTHHGLSLLHQKIDGTPLAKRMIAAYLIGGYSSRAEFENLDDIALCNSPEQLHCVAHWDTYSEAFRDEHEALDTLCVNPLTWTVDGALASRDKHQGAVPVAGEYHLDFAGDDAARGVVFAPLQAPIANLVEAQCAGGRLYINDQSDTDWGNLAAAGDTYHGLDYPMFHMDIRNNAILRATTYLQRQAATAEPGNASPATTEPATGDTATM